MGLQQPGPGDLVKLIISRALIDPPDRTIRHEKPTKGRGFYGPCHCRSSLGLNGRSRTMTPRTVDKGRPGPAPIGLPPLPSRAKCP